MNSTTTFHLNWLRESAAGHLEADLGTKVQSRRLELAVIGLLPEQQPGRVWGAPQFNDLRTPARLPEWAQRRLQNFFGGDAKPELLTLVESFCNRVRDQAWNLDEAHVFLPYFSRRQWIGRFSLLPSIGFERPAGLAIAAKGVKPDSIGELALRTAAGAFAKREPKSPVRNECSRPLVAPWRNLLLERYGLEVPAAAPATCQLTMDAPGSLLAAWQNTPRERHCHYYSVFSRLALAVQNSLRRWTLASFATSPEQLADFETGGDVLVYAATRPHAEKKAHDFSYDVLDPNLMEFAFSRASRRLEPLLRTAYDELRAAGRPDDARQYLRRDVRLYAPKLAERARRRRHVRAMLVAEGVLIYAMIRFASRLKSFDSARAVTLAAEDLARDFDERIRRLFFFDPKPEEFSTMLFLEASSAIHTAMGGEQTLKIGCATVDGASYTGCRGIAESPMPI